MTFMARTLGYNGVAAVITFSIGAGGSGGGGGAGSTNSDGTSGGAGAAGGTAYKTW
jgi:hypothetical protein